MVSVVEGEWNLHQAN